MHHKQLAELSKLRDKVIQAERAIEFSNGLVVDIKALLADLIALVQPDLVHFEDDDIPDALLPDPLADLDLVTMDDVAPEADLLPDGEDRLVDVDDDFDLDEESGTAKVQPGLELEAAATDQVLLLPDPLADNLGFDEVDEGGQIAADQKAKATSARFCRIATLLDRVRPTLEAVMRIQRKPATKMLTVRIQDLQHHDSYAVLRIPVTTVSAADMRLLVKVCLKRVTDFIKEKGLDAAIVMQSYDGESTNIRVSEDEDTPTTIKQVTSTKHLV